MPIVHGNARGGKTLYTGCSEQFQRIPGRLMSKEDCIEMNGVVVEKFPAGTFSVQLEGDHMVLAHLAGKLRRNRIRVLAGDRVTVEMSPYDLTKGRIVYRHK
jgi:translation initiation factor IF-1